MSGNNGETPKAGEGGSTPPQAQNSQTAGSGAGNSKDFESPYSIYMTSPQKGAGGYGPGTGSYGNQNYGFAPQGGNQYPQQYPPQAYQQQQYPQQNSQYVQQNPYGQQNQQNYSQTAQNQSPQNASNTSSPSPPSQNQNYTQPQTQNQSFPQNSQNYQNAQTPNMQYQPQYQPQFQPPPQYNQMPPNLQNHPYQNAYNQVQNSPDLGSESERKKAVIDAIQRDSSILEYRDKTDLAKWGNLSGIGTIGVFTTLFLPVALLMMKKTPKESKLRYLRIGMIVQLCTGGLFLYSSYQVSNIVKRIESKYFSHMDLEQIKNFRSNMWNQQTPSAQSVGPVLANMNRPPFGGNQQYFQPQGQNQSLFSGNSQAAAQNINKESDNSDQKESS